LIAESSGYHRYEVQDILEHLAWNIKQVMKFTNKEVELKLIGRFKRKLWPARTQYSGYIKRQVQMPERITVGFAPSRQLKFELNTDEEGKYYDKKLQAKREKELQYTREYNKRRKEIAYQKWLEQQKQLQKSQRATEQDFNQEFDQQLLQAKQTDEYQHELNQYVRNKFAEAAQQFTNRTEEDLKQEFEEWEAWNDE
jgi:nucleoid DNA-binding protein